MMRILIAAAVVALLGGVPATAQYGGGFGGGYGGGGSGYRGGWDDEDEWRERRRERRREYRDYGGGGYGPPRMRMGSLCVTSRGSCQTRQAPPNARCGCDIPGFGFKRGAVQ